MKKLEDILESLKGSVLGIGIDESLLDIISENENIHTCYIMTDKTQNKNFNYFGKGRNKKINIKKIRKVFKKKKIDYIICNYNVIKPFIRRFISNSIYINKEKLYIYGNKKDLKELESKYKRYTNDVKLEDNKDMSILIINNKNVKTNFFKDKKYIIKDAFESGLDILTNFLAR